MKPDTTTSPALKPNWKFILKRPAYFIAFGFGSGLARFAPGTWGTLVAYPLYFLWLYFIGIHTISLLIISVILFLVGIWLCDVTEKAIGQHDYGGIVWDEIVAMLLILALSPAKPLFWISAFCLFRFFDILKPWPIRCLDRQVEGGFGVMIDDILAAFFTLIVQWILVWAIQFIGL